MPEISRDEWDPETQKLYDELTAFDPTDAGLALAEGVVGPFGGFVDQVRRRRDTRQVEFMVALAKGYRDLLGDVSQLPQTPEFKMRVLQISEEASEARNHEKRAQFIAAGLNLGSGHSPNDEVDLFLATLGRLEVVHLRLLAGLATRRPQRLSTDMKPLFDAIVELTPGVDSAGRVRLYDDLGALGLVEGRNLIVEGGDQLHDEPDGLLTRFGRSFVQFLADPRNATG